MKLNGKSGSFRKGSIYCKFMIIYFRSSKVSDVDHSSFVGRYRPVSLVGSFQIIIFGNIILSFSIGGGVALFIQ